MFPFTEKEKKKQRAWASTFSLGGLLLVAIGISNNSKSILVGMNTMTLIGVIAFLLGIIYLIDLFD